MKRMMKRLLPVLMAIAPLTICAQKVYELKDISGKVQVNVIVNDKNVEYSVLHDNDVMVAPSPIFMKLTDGSPDPQVIDKLFKELILFTARAA